MDMMDLTIVGGGREVYCGKAKVFSISSISGLLRPALRSWAKSRRTAVSLHRLRDLLVEQGKIVFPSHIIGRKARQANHDRPTLPQRLECLCLVACLAEYIAKFPIRHRQIALPTGITRIGFRQTLSDRETVAVVLQSRRQIASPTSTPSILSYDTANSAQKN